MLHNIVSGWLDLLLHHGLIGPVLALVLAAFVVLAVANAIIWPLVGIKHAATRKTEQSEVDQPA